LQQNDRNTKFKTLINGNSLKLMEKNFDQWNEKKKKIHAAGTAEFYHEREV